CDTPLAEQTHFCAACGKAVLASPEDDVTESTVIGSDLTIPLPEDAEESESTVVDSDLTTPLFSNAEDGGSAAKNGTELLQRLSPISLSDQATLHYMPESFNSGEDIDESRRGTNWHKDLGVRVLDHPAITPRPLPSVALLPRTHLPAEHLPIPELENQRSTPPSLFFWIATGILLIIFLGGLLDIAITLGRGSQQSSSGISLKVTPAIAGLGTTIALRGTHFSPSGRIGLTRDTTIPVIDTGSLSVIQADKKGDFFDTVIIDTNWQPGPHIIHAEDAKLHKLASFTVIVTGHSASLRPAHLLLSVNTLDLGSGDQATNSIKTITLINAGGGQISWRASTTEPWLLLSPNNGTFSSGQSDQIAIAANRSQLKPGSYTAQITFLSTAGEVTLPVKLQTTPIQADHEPVLQLTPAALSFTGTDGGNNPPAQNVTISNPGVQPLQWNTSISGGNGWLSVSPQSGQMTKGGSQNVAINVNINTSLPGTYSGTVTFTGLGQVKDSPQSVYVSLTVLPQCSLQVAPGSLTFSSISQQTGPADKSINLNVSQGCSAQLPWTASAYTNNGGSWLSLSSSKGTTPSYPSVHINTTGLNSGTYTGGILFNSKSGTLTIPVSFTLAPPTTPIMVTTPAAMSFSTIIGQSAPAAQTVAITNGGGGTLTWQAVPATNSGGSWIVLSSTSGALQANQSTSLSISSAVLSGMTPGTYNGTVTITGTDSFGHTAVGSPQILPISFLVQAPCTITAVPTSLAFTGAVGQANPASQAAAITASGTCTHSLNWTATTSGGTWLTTTPSSGTVSLSTSSATQVSISLTGLAANTYQGTVTVTATDSATNQQIGIPQTIGITLTVLPACTLQTPSPGSENFTAEAGSNPATQSFKIGVQGTCSGVTITPTVTGQNWLSVSPSSATINGGSTTFTVTVTSASLAAGPYTNSISLAATSGTGTVFSSPQTVNVALTVAAAPALSASPGSGLNFNVITGTSSQAITISNTGGGPLNWTATLPSNTPYASLSAGSGTNLIGGTNTSINVIVNATGLTGGTTYSTSVTLTATNPITGNTVAGSPITINVVVNVAAPSMNVNTNTLSFTTTAGTNPPSQSITLTNTGGNSLAWTAGKPSQPWLSVDVTSGSDASGATSTINFSVNGTGLAAGSYSATEVITPSVGKPVTITVNLTVT
ncbi:MAG: choice-of-anchor D domain-containing protein, partial [Chloroflexota bacterium]|nr:choice-of-anchor D domain-containing protein [Chloroflexota bacterium]